MASKKERKEEARAQRLKKAEAERRRKRRNRLIYWGSGVLVVLLIAVFIVTQGAADKAASKKVADSISKLLAAAPADAKTAGCSKVSEVDPYSPPGRDHDHIGSGTSPTAPSLATYASLPATSGPHDQAPQDAGAYTTPPDVFKAIHSLEHGAVVFWYDPSTPPAALAADTAAVNKYLDHVVMAPYDYPGNGKASTLPTGTSFALTSWHKLQTCKLVPAPSVLVDFMSKYRWPTLGGGPFQGSTDPKLEKGSPI